MTIVSASSIGQTPTLRKFGKAGLGARATLFVPGQIILHRPTMNTTRRSRLMARDLFSQMAPNFRGGPSSSSRYKDGHWSQPEVAPLSGQFQDADPYITADGKHFYFISDRPVELAANASRITTYRSWTSIGVRLERAAPSANSGNSDYG